ncbi:hypothetical protein [Eilatimonas milleporae]|uniref:Uncharacterized protein n=1 Tax=Eilatimonas milleporae TaxID=911205 RepID=A0A3M0BVE0_9PROT|nr:hypothetical protein [Eilatimonas milleporae]RMB01544.1 hypothetical protein BXY39_3732 [Eilatimonas milleporae]
MPGSSGLGVSTADIDPLLAGRPKPLSNGNFPANYTRDLANGAFAELDRLQAVLRTELIAAIESDSRVQRVQQLTLVVNPLQVRLSQMQTSVNLDISGISASARLRLAISVPFCSPVFGEVDLSNIRASGSYNLFTGKIQNVDINYRVDNEDISCSNPIGEALAVLVRIFTDIDGLLSDGIDNAIRDIEGSANMQTLFSIRDFAESLTKMLSNEVLGSGLPLQLRNRLQNIVDAGGREGLRALNEVINTNNLSTGLLAQLTIDRGPTENAIGLVGAHQQVDIIEVDQINQGTLISMRVPPNTASIDVYFREPGKSLWTYGGTSTFGAITIGGAPFNTELKAVGNSALIPGLRSIDGQMLKVRTNPCTIGCPPLP